MSWVLAAADRRPVDPPPVVQLRIYEGPTLEESKDITLGYNANYFVFVDLQHARPMANGRVQTPAATSPPVLTGAPVSGMAYLDRPTEAGYFLFPDLSVRHEGRYVLGFSLYEEIKDEEDMDVGDMDSEPGFLLRMKLLSAPFVVFSAKKFPGLTSSTSLSRTISEQGCRVRIRRDVRMRRRDGKPSAADDYDKDDEAARRRRTQTPDVRKDQYHRGRSVSNSSDHRTPYPAMPEQRRPSDVDSFPPPPPPPPPSQHGPPVPPPTAQMRYGPDGTSNGYAQHYVQPAAPPISPTSAGYHHPGQPSPYVAAAQPPHHHPPPPPPPPAYGYHQNMPAPPPQHYVAGPTASTIPRDAYDARPPTSGVPHSPSHGQYPTKETGYGRRLSEYRPDADYARGPETRRDSHLAPVQSPGQETPSRITLPPLSRAVPDTPSYPLSGLGPSSGYHSSSVSSASSAQSRGDYIEPGPAVTAPPVPETPARAGAKRAYNETFAETTTSLYDGQRPQDPHHMHGRRSIYDAEEPSQMFYHRADGKKVYKSQNHFFS